MQVLSVAHEVLVLLYAHYHLDVTGDAVQLACMTLAMHVESHTVLDSLGDVYLHNFLAGHYTLAATALALVRDDGASASATRAGCLTLHGTQHGAHGAIYHT